MLSASVQQHALAMVAVLTVLVCAALLPLRRDLDVLRGHLEEVSTTTASLVGERDAAVAIATSLNEQLGSLYTQLEKRQHEHQQQQQQALVQRVADATAAAAASLPDDRASAASTSAAVHAPSASADRHASADADASAEEATPPSSSSSLAASQLRDDEGGRLLVSQAASFERNASAAQQHRVGPDAITPEEGRDGTPFLVRRIDPLPDGEYFCEVVRASNCPAGPRQLFSHMSNEEVCADWKRTEDAYTLQFKYCSINARVGCESPPCTGETGKRTKWPAGLLSNFFTDHFVETQVSDVFFMVLNPFVAFYAAAGTDASNSVVLDVGSNAGYFSMVAASIGYEVHAVDVLPFCSMHVATNARENGFAAPRVVAHNLGLSDKPGSLIQVPFINCKGGLSFQASSIDVQEKKDKAAALVPVQRLEDFVRERVLGGAAATSRRSVVKLLKMDTEGSEIDILKSGMALFESGQVRRAHLHRPRLAPLAA